jgi:CO/xanthine dehydrogenase FAD-binding subunit
MNPLTYTRAHNTQEAVDAFQGNPTYCYVAGATDVVQPLQEYISAPGLPWSSTRFGTKTIS